MRTGMSVQVQEQDRPALSGSSVTVEGKINGPDFAIHSDAHDVRPEPVRMTDAEARAWRPIICYDLHQVTKRFHHIVPLTMEEKRRLTSEEREKYDAEEEHIAAAFEILIFKVLPKRPEYPKAYLRECIEHWWTDQLRHDSAETKEEHEARKNCENGIDDEKHEDDEDFVAAQDRPVVIRPTDQYDVKVRFKRLRNPGMSGDANMEDEYGRSRRVTMNDPLLKNRGDIGDENGVVDDSEDANVVGLAINADVRDAINAFPARTRQAVQLRLEGYTFDEIGTEIGITGRRANQIVMEALEQLKKQFGGNRQKAQ